MNAERLVHDANQIALYFAAYPREEAIAGVADHLRKFWDPRMRAALGEILAAGECRVHDLVREAGRRLYASPNATP
jgi:formate dehydrogenase subunit delta